MTDVYGKKYLRTKKRRNMIVYYTTYCKTIAAIKNPVFMIIRTITEIQKVGANVKLSLSIFDRNEGGKEKIERLGINHYSIFTYDNRKEDLVY